jgi:hypothetical protein
MFNDRISDYFEGVAAKYLKSVDADPDSSNQHEIGGLVKAGFQQYLGAPEKSEEFRFNAKQVYFTDNALAPDICEGTVTWYDCRRNKPLRRPEFRLYYNSNAVTDLFQAGDFFLVAKMRDGSLLMVCTPPGSTIESQLKLLFGLHDVKKSFVRGEMDAVELLLPLRLMLEDLGLEVSKPDIDDGVWLGRMISLFGGKVFPKTSEFSSYARNSLEKSVDPLRFPDQTLVDWMDHEEKLFRIYERHIVQQRLCIGFGEDGGDVDEFISFSLSVQNRRKSRVGHAFEGHLDFILKVHGLRFEQGRGKGFTTENNSKPDFMFPGFSEYRDPDFPAVHLFMLGAKTTCKDRWRQVLSEAHRIQEKHLITLEAAISEGQTNEMKASGLQLVVPRSMHSTYSKSQADWLIGLSDFIVVIKQAWTSDGG